MKEMIHAVKMAIQLDPELRVLCSIDSGFYTNWFKIGSPEYLTYDGAMFKVEKVSIGPEADGGVTHVTIRWIRTYGLVEE